MSTLTRSSLSLSSSGSPSPGLGCFGGHWGYSVFGVVGPPVPRVTIYPRRFRCRQKPLQRRCERSSRAPSGVLSMRPSGERSRSSPQRQRKPSSSSHRFRNSVFINCPFDADYQRILRAVIFAVHDCGFVARSALEVSDSSQNRLGKIVSIIESSQFGIHDLSRTQSDAAGYPRFNMPLELGLFLGCKANGGARRRNKNALVLDKSRYRYRRFISDNLGPRHREPWRHRVWCDSRRQGLAQRPFGLQASERTCDVRALSNVQPATSQALRSGSNQSYFSHLRGVRRLCD